MKYYEQNMIIEKSWAEYAKEINSLRSQLRYMKKSVMYRGGGDGQSVYENQVDIIELQNEIERLCKLRNAAKAIEKAAGYKLGESKEL